MPVRPATAASKPSTVLRMGAQPAATSGNTAISAFDPTRTECKSSAKLRSALCASRNVPRAASSSPLPSGSVRDSGGGFPLCIEATRLDQFSPLG